MNKSVKYRISIIEPSPVVRQGLKSLLLAEGDFEIHNEFEDLQTFISDDSSYSGGVILINPAIINFHKQFAARNIFNDHSDKTIIALVYTYVDSGALDSFDGIVDIYDEGAILAKKIRKAVDSHESNCENSIDTDELSTREKEILASVAKGMTNKEIADQLNISTHTVVSHRKNITRKIGIKTVSGLTLYAVFNNIISKDEM